MSQPHRAREIGLGAVAILIGAALLVGSRGLGAIPGQNYGADTLPRLIAALAIGTGIAIILTIGGFFGIWPLIDLIMILVGSFKDKQDRYVANW